MGKLQAVTDGIVVLAIVYALGNLINGIVLAYQWIQCIPYM
jgi:hypothetical protein